MLAIRGAVRVPRNDRSAIYRETRRLLSEILRRNDLRQGQIVSAFFTMTPDLDADFPAYAARSMGWTDVPMLGAQETAVPGALDRVVRVLVHAEAPGPARHVYLGEAAAMRPDLAEDAESGAPPAPPAPEFGALLVCGLGLIGGSTALALRRSGPFHALLGQDPDRRAREMARAAGAVSEVVADLEALLPRADVILLAMPVGKIPGWLERHGPALAPGQVVLDVGSTKTDVVRAMSRLPEGVEAMGGHPMAGSERTGMGSARPDLFEGATWALVETDRTGPRARRVATSLVESTGAIPLFVEAEAHDRVVATTSHLPYLTSVALATQAGSTDRGPRAAALAGPGLRDTTRLAASDPELMAGILHSNWPRVREALDRHLRGLGELRDELEALLGEGGGEDDLEALRELLAAGRRARERLFR